MASFTGLKQVGGGLLDYMMKHRPDIPEEDELLSQGLHDLEELFPGIYKNGEERYRTSGEAVTHEAMDALRAVRGNPDAAVDIFRAVPKGVRDFNVGDWVTTSKSYAHKHGGHALNDEYDIITGKAKASDLYNPGDSIAEMGFWGLPMKGTVTRALPFAAGVTGGLLAMDAEEAEAAAIPDFEKLFPKLATKAGREELNKLGLLNDRGMMYAGTLEEPVFDAVRRRDPSITKNEVWLSRHPIDNHVANGEMEMEEMARDFADFLNNSHTPVIANFPGADRHKNPGKGMLAKKDPNFFVGPFMSGEDGEFIFKTGFEPFGKKREFVARQLGRPETSPIFVTQSSNLEQSNSQLPGISVVSLPAYESIMPEKSKEGNAQNSSFWPSMARQFGLGTRGVIEGLGTGATLGFGDPGRVIADVIGLPSPETDIERQRVGLNAGVTDALTTFAGGVGAAKMAANPVVRGVGMELADKPLLGAGIGGLLGLLGYDYEEE